MTAMSRKERNRKYEQSVKGRQARGKANLRFREAQKYVERQRIEKVERSKVRTEDDMIEAMELAEYEANAELPEKVETKKEVLNRAMLFGKRE